MVSENLHDKSDNGHCLALFRIQRAAIMVLNGLLFFVGVLIILATSGYLRMAERAASAKPDNYGYFPPETEEEDRVILRMEDFANHRDSTAHPREIRKAA